MSRTPPSVWVAIAATKRRQAAEAQALAALDVIDANSTPGTNNRRQLPLVNVAYADLADALDVLYGPLPAIRLRGYDDRDDRDDDIGDELADREDRP